MRRVLGGSINRSYSRTTFIRVSVWTLLPSPQSTVYNLCRCAGTNDAVAPTEIAWEFILPTLRRPSSNAKTWRPWRRGGEGKALLKNVKSCLCRIVPSSSIIPSFSAHSLSWLDKSFQASDLWKLARVIVRSLTVVGTRIFEYDLIEIWRSFTFDQQIYGKRES